MSVAEADLEGVLDHAKLGSYQRVIIVLCALMVMIDGFATQMIGLVAPAIAVDWGVPAAAFGPVFGVGLFGGLVGALLLGSLGDRFGRKPVVLACVLLFSVVSVATPLVHGVGALVVARLVCGLGLGGALPNLIAITSEYAPKVSRARIAAVMFCGFPLGSVLAGVVSAQLMPDFGWASVFYVSGLFPLALLPFFVGLVPESTRFLVATGHEAKAARILARTNPETRWNGRASAHSAQKASVGELFAHGRAAGTLLLWLTLFASLLLTVFMVSWLPLVARAGGIGLKSAVLAVSAFNLGGIAGCFLIGAFNARYGVILPIAVAYAIGAVGVCLVGFTGHSGPLFLAASLVAGLFTVGAQMCTVGFLAAFYDTQSRATGVGWGLGIGRIGAVVGPTIGGVFIGLGMPTPTLFLIAGAMALVAALGIVAVGRVWARAQPQGI
jgi:AAHS family 4-hydroxybenzoate transporter-like MFS transporter